MELDFEKQQISFLAECIREEYVERNTGLLESADIAKYIEEEDYDIVKHFIEEEPASKRSAQGKENTARQDAYKEVSETIIRDGFSSFEKVSITTEKKINDYVIRLVAKIQSIPIIGAIQPFRVRLPAKGVVGRADKGRGLRFALKDVPEAYKDAMQQRIESNRDMKHIASEVVGAIEDMDWQRASGNLKTFLHANKFRTIKMIDTVIVAARTRMTGFSGSGESKAALSRYMGGYSELATAIYNIMVVLVGLLFAAAMLPIIKMIYVVIKKMLSTLVNFISKPVSYLVGLVGNVISFLYRIIGKISISLPKKKTLLKHGKNIVNHTTNAKKMVRESTQMIDKMLINLKQKYAKKAERKKKKE